MIDVAPVEREYREIRYQALIVDGARRSVGRARDRELTYGTTTPRIALRILELAGAGPRDVFYDLGCGLGVPTIVAALVCKRATGIDVLEPLLDYGRAVAKALRLRNAHFVAGDLAKQDTSDGTVFYSYSTCLSPRTLARMAKRIALAKPGARAVTVTHALEHKALRLVQKTALRWGALDHAVYVHERI